GDIGRARPRLSPPRRRVRCSGLLSGADRRHRPRFYRCARRFGRGRTVSTWLVAAYPWIKAFHLVSVVAWMAGLLYLPRLFVYHAGSAIGSEMAATFTIMERRLLRGIMLPAGVATVVFGLLLVATPGVVDWQQRWVWAKLVLVVA